MHIQVRVAGSLLAFLSIGCLIGILVLWSSTKNVAILDTYPDVHERQPSDQPQTASSAGGQSPFSPAPSAAIALLGSNRATAEAAAMTERYSQEDSQPSAFQVGHSPRADVEPIDQNRANESGRDNHGRLQPALAMDQRFPRADLDQLVQGLSPTLQQQYAQLRKRYPQYHLLESDDFHAITHSQRQILGHHLTPDQAVEYAAWVEQSERLQRQLLIAHAHNLGISHYGVADDGRGYALLGFADDRPLYSFTLNREAAISTAADLVRRNAGFDAVFGADVDGSGFFVNVNDHGTIHDHPEFTLPDGTSRIVVTEVNDGGNRSHMTHVAGTVAAHGYQSAAMGMAPAVWIRSLIQQNQLHIYNYAMSYPGQSERSIVGNTSLGATTSNEGLYTGGSRNLDTWLWDHPYYLHFYAAGNDGGNGFASLSANTPVSKNTMAVGAINDVNRDAEGNYVSGGGLAGFSSRGPTYDGRIKPDIVANGTGVYSPDSATGYGNSQGTSMASPNAAGSAILLVDYFNKRFPGQFMRASTTRALIINTTDDLGNPGPDYRFGWGVMNTVEAGRIIRSYADDPSIRVMVEDRLHNGESFSLPYTSDGGPVRVTLAWHDIPGVARAAGDRGANLINNLHLKLIGPEGEEYFPFVMPYTEGTDSHDAFSEELYNANAVTGVNNRDTVNQVLIANAPAGDFTIEISHSGNLHDDQAQDFSLAISGLVYRQGTSSPTITDHSPTQNEGGNDLTFTIDGSDFMLGAQLLLRRDGSQTAYAEHVVVSSTRLSGFVDSSDMDWGYWDVVVRNPDGAEAVASNGLLITGFTTSEIFFSDFASDPGLTLQGDWEIGEPSGVQGNPATAMSGSQILGYNLGGQYANNMSATYATFPMLDVSGHNAAQLAFYRWLGVENGTYDNASIEYQLDGGSWQELWSNPTVNLQDSEWLAVSYTIDTTGADDLRVRFVMGATDGSVTYAGWNIDAVRISVIEANDSDEPPQFTSTPPDTIISVGDGSSYAITTSDPDTAPEDLTLSVSGNPAWLSLTDHGNGTGTLAGTATQSGSHTVLLSVSDGTFTTHQEFMVQVLPEGGNTPPEITTESIPEGHVGHPYTATIQASDADGHSVQLSASNLPGWLVFSDNGDNSASLSGTPSTPHIGSATFTVHADDGFDEVEKEFTMVVNPRAVISLTVSEMEVNEGDGTAEVTVSRSDNGFGSVSVDYATSNGTAIAGEDYVATSGTLTWDDGDLQDKTISIPIIDDDQPEITEYFQLSLSNVQGVADLGTITSITISIIDNDAPPGVAIDIGDWYIIDHGSASLDQGVRTLTRTDSEDAHAFQGYVVNLDRVDLQQVADYVEIRFRMRANTGNNSARQVSWGLFQGAALSDHGQTSVSNDWVGYVHRLGTRSSGGTTGMLVGRQGDGDLGIMNHVTGENNLDGAVATNSASSLNQNTSALVRLRVERISDTQLRVMSIYETEDQDRNNSGSGQGISWNYRTQDKLATLTSVHTLADGPTEFTGFAIASRGNNWTLEWIGAESNAPMDIEPFAPIITMQPQDQERYAGEPLQIAVTAQAWPPPSYQWYHDAVAINGATASTYSVAASDASDSGAYYVVVDNGVGEAAISQTVTVSIILPARIISMLRLPGWYWEIDPGHPEQEPDDGSGEQVEFAPVHRQQPQTLNLLEMDIGG